MPSLLVRGVAVGPVEAVLFDKDGTLSNSEPMLFALAQARVFHCLRLTALTKPAFSQSVLLKDLLERAYGLTGESIHPAGITAVASRSHNLIATATVLTQVGFGWPESLAISEEVFSHTDALHGQGSPHPPHPTEGLLPFLASLKAAGVCCGVISNDDAAGIDAFLGAHGLRRHFGAVWSADHRPAKPDPEAVHGLCSELGVPSTRCALIGDANTDLHMARRAGIAVVVGYRAGWSLPPPLDRDFPLADHWKDLTISIGE